MKWQATTAEKPFIITCGGGGWAYNGHVLSQRVARTNLGLLHFLGAKVCQVFCEEFVFLQIFKHNNRTP